MLIICVVAVSALVTYWYIDGMYKNTLVSYRNFYGVIRVIEKDEKGWPSTAYQLLHGVTIHGVQLEEKTQRKLATAYYVRIVVLGWAILNHPGLLNVPEITGRSGPMEKYKTNIRMWTDDYSNLFQILK